MRLLLDTHAFIWAIASPDRLSDTASKAITSASNALSLSSATAWELATKHRIGKLPQAGVLLSSYEDIARELALDHLPITYLHAIRAGQLPGDHRDPFDRMLVAQAQLEGLAIVTRDPAFGKFDVNVVW